MPKLRLPPLPAASKWRTYFPRALFPLPLDPFAPVTFPNRIMIANRDRTDEFVRALGLKSNDIVLEQFCGPGQLTRSLVNGGNKTDEDANIKAWQEHGQVVTKPTEGYKASGLDSQVKKRKSWVFPEWLHELSTTQMNTDASEAAAEDETAKEELPRPRVVIATESSPELLVRGLGLEPSNVPDRIETLDRYGVPGDKEGNRFVNDSAASKAMTNEERTAKLAELGTMALQRLINDPGHVYPSAYESNLLLNPSSPHVTSLQRTLLLNPVVAQYIDPYDEAQYGPRPVFAEPNPHNRPWSAPPPNIVFVVQVPDGPRGETMLHRWIYSAIGASEGVPGWIWTYGRVRCAFLLGRRFYDRLTSGPGEACHSKLSIATHALFDLKRLPPYHHVFNNDKGSRGTEPRPPGFNTTQHHRSEYLEDYRASVDKGPRTIMYPRDIYPRPVNTVDSEPLERPHLLGLELIPKINTPITLEQRQVWDYVLRRMFVRQSLTLRESLPSLAFGATLLVDKIEGRQETGNFKGVDCDTNKIIRDLTVEEWHRIVDVVDKWPFKPESMLLVDYGAQAETKD